MIDRLVEGNPAKFPWFRDDSSIHLNLKRYIKGESLTHLFGGFSTEGR
jgi:hypothetical protein